MLRVIILTISSRLKGDIRDIGRETVEIIVLLENYMEVTEQLNKVNEGNRSLESLRYFRRSIRWIHILCCGRRDVIFFRAICLGLSYRIGELYEKK